mmetsp:Transcript_16695/g.32414  ORF Transcript_16695/g.32414 Transcript_16695/m.32414 type:complete len:458 (+) Transcript_16695:881-2254(+)|eukprot:CAMPEP_0171499812 /NCGR_PEP_ID=MMETSP0958-20121227/8635_1 /TAXON_ID=87120 /ORGANISM="Aurantiochytrium limacinum, Strain ATCCMYA-1381" /LENGTH=457 /DNA_ID=CAMNT_0012034407 /DNA_START=816 /DNA_END=2189 /DNA_ORIENTATION=-
MEEKDEHLLSESRSLTVENAGSNFPSSINVANGSSTAILREVPVNVLEDVESLRKERMLLAKERAKLETLRAEGFVGKISGMESQHRVVHLNVGGKSFVTSMNSIASCNGSLLYSIVKHSSTMRASVLEGEHDEVFIDRDGEHFAFILNWLRAKACCSGYKPPPSSVREDVLIEAEYFGLDDLVDYLRHFKSGGADRMDGSRLLELKAMGARDFDGANFSNGMYDGICFSSDQARRHARSARFTDSSLQRARFEGMDLSDADFTGSLLQNANFHGAKLSGACFDGANLTGADFSGADLRGAIIERAESLSRCNFAGSRMDGLELRHRHDLQHVCMERVFGPGADLRGSNMQSANLKGAKLQNAQLQGCCLRYSSLQPSEKPVLNGGSPEQETDLEQANLEGCDFLCATLQRANFRSAKLGGAIFSGANTRGACYEQTVFQTLRGGPGSSSMRRSSLG